MRGQAEFRRSVLAVWNSNPADDPLHQTGLGGYRRQTGVRASSEVLKGSGPHNHVKVQKAVLKPGRRHRAEELQGLGGRACWGPTQTLLKEFDVADKIADPSVHRYLHEAEKTGNIAPPTRTDNDRLIVV